MFYLNKKLLPGLLLLTPQLAWSAELNVGNTAWVLTSTALVLFMTLPGLSLFYGGLVRSKNVLSVLMQCFVTTQPPSFPCSASLPTVKKFIFIINKICRLG
jgi:ammonium transporter, Amt family